MLTRSYSPFILQPCRWTNHPHRVLKRFIETKVPPGTPDAVMAQTGTEKKRRSYFTAKNIYDHERWRHYFVRIFGNHVHSVRSQKIIIDFIYSFFFKFPCLRMTVSVCLSLYLSVCLSVSLSLSIYIYMYIYIYIYIYKHIYFLFHIFLFILVELP
jgi:hypothetical protein